MGGRTVRKYETTKAPTPSKIDVVTARPVNHRGIMEKTEIDAIRTRTQFGLKSVFE